MYLLYLDDAGSAANQNEDYFVLGGIAVPENSIRWISYKLEQYASEIGNETSTDPKQVEFHASEIFSGKTTPRNYYRSKEQRIEIIKKSLMFYPKHMLP